VLTPVHVAGGQHEERERAQPPEERAHQSAEAGAEHLAHHRVDERAQERRHQHQADGLCDVRGLVFLAVRPGQEVHQAARDAQGQERREGLEDEPELAVVAVMLDGQRPYVDERHEEHHRVGEELPEGEYSDLLAERTLQVGRLDATAMAERRGRDNLMQ